MKTKYIKRKYPKFYILAAFTLLCFLAVGYSYINSDLGIEANALTASNRWNIVISNMQVNSSSTYESEDNNTSGSQLSFNVSLKEGTQNYIIDFDVTNNGTLVAYLSDISYDLNDYKNLDTYLEYKYIYSDGTEVKINDILNPNETKHMKLYITYLKKLPYEYMEASNSKSIAYGININYRFNGSQKTKVSIYNNSNELLDTKYISENNDTVEISNGENYKFIVCTNGEAYQENEIIKITNVDNSYRSYCKLYKEINEINDKFPQTADGIWNPSSVNLYQLSDYSYSSGDGFNPHRNINIYMNGNNIDIHGYESEYYKFQFSDMYIKFINNTGNSIVNLYDKSIGISALIMEGGTYNIDMSVLQKGIQVDYLILKNATLNISNTDFHNIITINSYAIISNSTIHSYENTFYLDSGSYSSNINAGIDLINSSITSQNSSVIDIDDYYTTSNTKINICNSTLNSATYDVEFLNGEIIYSNNSNFNSTAPRVKDMSPGSYIIKNDVACEIANKRLKTINEYIDYKNNINVESDDDGGGR